MCGAIPVPSPGDDGGAGEAALPLPVDVPSTRQRRGASAAPDAPPAAHATLKSEAAASNREVSDKLIEVFRSKQPAEWRRLIAYSKQWPMLAQGVLDRCVCVL